MKQFGLYANNDALAAYFLKDLRSLQSMIILWKKTLLQMDDWRVSEEDLRFRALRLTILRGFAEVIALMLTIVANSINDSYSFGDGGNDVPCFSPSIALMFTQYPSSDQ